MKTRIDTSTPVRLPDEFVQAVHAQHLAIVADRNAAVARGEQLMDGGAPFRVTKPPGIPPWR